MLMDLFDIANSRTIGFFSKLRSHLYLKYHRVNYGNNTYIKKNFEIRKTDNADIVIGNNCIIQEYVFFLLTKPKPKLIIGDNVSIGRSTVIAIKDELKIGENTEISSNDFICDQNHGIKKDKLITEQPSEISPVDIGKDCWIGTNSVILKGVKVGNGSVIAACSLVNKDIPEYQVWGGNPAKFIKNR
jgi:acetyltransferase-like isoleucine patch superfamily enzyme